MRPYILAIDPGTKASGVCLVRTAELKPLWCAKLENRILVDYVIKVLSKDLDIALEQMLHGIQVVIERMQGNSMPVSSDVFLTCEWIGRFDTDFHNILNETTEFVFRRDEYKKLCANIYSRNDKGIRSALVDRFAYGQKNYGKGTAKAPGWFHGFSADTWSAYAIAVTFFDMCAEKEITVY